MQTPTPLSLSGPQGGMGSAVSGSSPKPGAKADEISPMQQAQQAWQTTPFGQPTPEMPMGEQPPVNMDRWVRTLSDQLKGWQDSYSGLNEKYQEAQQELVSEQMKSKAREIAEESKASQSSPGLHPLVTTKLESLSSKIKGLTKAGAVQYPKPFIPPINTTPKTPEAAPATPATSTLAPSLPRTMNRQGFMSTGSVVPKEHMEALKWNTQGTPDQWNYTIDPNNKTVSPELQRQYSGQLQRDALKYQQGQDRSLLTGADRAARSYLDGTQGMRITDGARSQVAHAWRGGKNTASGWAQPANGLTPDERPMESISDYWDMIKYKTQMAGATVTDKLTSAIPATLNAAGRGASQAWLGARGLGKDMNAQADQYAEANDGKQRNAFLNYKWNDPSTEQWKADLQNSGKNFWGSVRYAPEAALSMFGTGMALKPIAGLIGASALTGGVTDEEGLSFNNEVSPVDYAGTEKRLLGGTGGGGALNSYATANNPFSSGNLRYAGYNPYSNPTTRTYAPQAVNQPDPTTGKMKTTANPYQSFYSNPTDPSGYYNPAAFRTSPQTWGSSLVDWGAGARGTFTPNHAAMFGGQNTAPQAQVNPLFANMIGSLPPEIASQISDPAMLQAILAQQGPRILDSLGGMR